MDSNPFEERYKQMTPQSAKLATEARAFLPGGDTRSVTYHRPYPSFVTEASGCTVTTADDETLVDFLNNYTQSVLGHAPDSVVEAVCKQFQRGNDVAAPTQSAVELAQRLTIRVPSIDLIRFCNSGTEATMNAIRGAMAATEREHVLKVQGGYHGTHDTVEVGIEGEGREHLGIPSDVESRVHTVPFNNTEALKTTFEERGEDLACFIVEPVLGVGGMIPATTDYLSTARDLTEAYGVVLIFDEVMTFRLAEGGAQERYGVTPDLTALGKLIGGGLPVGAFGGRTDLMEGFHPEDGAVNHSGTFNANPATMAGGCATLDALDQTAINRLNEMGDQLRIDLEAAAEGTDIPVQITGDGSLFQIHFTDDSIVDLASSTAGEAMEPLFLGMRTEGIFLAPRGMGNLSTPMGEPEINRFVEAFERVLTKLSSE